MKISEIQPGTPKPISRRSKKAIRKTPKNSLPKFILLQSEAQKIYDSCSSSSQQLGEENPESVDEASLVDKFNQFKIENTHDNKEKSPASSQQILKSSAFKPLKQIDFDIFSHHLAKGKVYSVALINGCGKFIFADKLASEHYEGSLNNLNKISFHNLILMSQKKEILRKLSQIKEYSERTVFKFIIYSKNTKRRYSSLAMPMYFSEQDLFNRFLKCLTMRIRPIEITFTDFQKYEGFWNKELVQNDVPIQCFLLETRLSASRPFLNQLNLRNDAILSKYIKSNLKKQIKKNIIPQKHRPNRRNCKKEKHQQKYTPQKKKANSNLIPTLNKDVERHEPSKDEFLIKTSIQNH